MTDFAKVVWIQVEPLGETGELGSNYRLSYDKHCLHRDRTGEDKRMFCNRRDIPTAVRCR